MFFCPAFRAKFAIEAGLSAETIPGLRLCGQRTMYSNIFPSITILSC